MKQADLVTVLVTPGCDTFARLRLCLGIACQAMQARGDRAGRRSRHTGLHASRPGSGVAGNNGFAPLERVSDGDEAGPVAVATNVTVQRQLRQPYRQP